MKKSHQPLRRNLEKFSNIFMQLGLVFVLLVVFLAMEYQTQQKDIVVDPMVYIATDLFTEKPVYYQKEPKPKLKVVHPTIKQKSQSTNFTEVVKTNTDIDIIEPKFIDTDEPEFTETIDHIATEKEPEAFEPEIFNYSGLQSTPIFKGCEGLAEAENKKCFDKKMKRFVLRNFDTTMGSSIGLGSGVYRINTQFIIDANGSITDVVIRAPHQKLKKEANRLLKKLPKFVPGKQNNKPVKVRYSLPITFGVE